MSNTSTMTRDKRNDDDDDASSKNGDKTCDNGDNAVVVPWSDLIPDVLFLIMMKLGTLDFVPFSGVCKSWRSLALSRRNAFMVSRPPLVMRKSPSCNKTEFYFMDFDGRMSKLVLPQLSIRECFGLTRGYLILFRRRTCDLLLVNPITRHQLFFPIDKSAVTTMFTGPGRRTKRAILVFSHAISECVLVVLCIETGEIWFSIAGKGTWNNVSCTFYIEDVIAFKGKIYTLSTDTDTYDCRLCEMRLHPEPKLTLLETKNFLHMPDGHPKFVSPGENLFVDTLNDWLFHELDFGEMKWVSREKTMGEYTVFVGCKNHAVAIKQKLWWVDTARLPCKGWRYNRSERTIGGFWVFYDNIWYFPHQCWNDEIIDE